MQLLFPLLLSLATVVPFGSSSRILVVTPFGTKSHKNVFEPLLRALGERGHEVTVIANTKSRNLGGNVTEYVPMDLDQSMQKWPNAYEQRKKGLFNSFFDFSFMTENCHKVFQDPQFNKLMRQQYDLVIFNAFMNVCFQGFLPKIGAPYIFVTSMAAPNTVTSRLGNWLPPSFVPNPFLPLSERMTFIERVQNLLLDCFFLITTPSFDAHHEAIYRKYLGEDIPSLAEIGRNISLLLMNSYLNFPSPRPVLPDVIEVGGMHCVPPKPLPKDLEEFVSGGKDGFIFFSMGSVVKSTDIPEEVRKMFINAFSRIKQRVLWKWDGEMDDLPSNVKLGKWLPQQDILGHKNIRLFITHGGLLSTQEAIYHGVPLLGIPIYIDQDLNMKQAEAAGFAVKLEILNVTETKLEQALTVALEDSRITETAKALSAAFRDQLQTPVERAVFWAEYVIRHRGAPHMRSAARDLTFIQYHSLDVLAFLSSVFLAVAVILVFVIRICYRSAKQIVLTSGSQNKKIGKSKSNNNKKNNKKKSKKQ